MNYVSVGNYAQPSAYVSSVSFALPVNEERDGKITLLLDPLHRFYLLHLSSKFHGKCLEKKPTHFAAAVMGFKVLAFEPVFENLQRICDGIYFNRVGELVELFEAAASDHPGNITFHKLVGRLDNSAVSATGAKMAFKSNEEIALQVKSIPLDDVIQESEPVLLVKIDVQGWEYHVLKGASKLLSRKKGEAPYLIYEEDERLLQASNSSAREIREFLHSKGYHQCTQVGTDAHCNENRLTT
ncbi:UNVERIFIED_CONTAM: hypothetical protein Sradi_3347800 [Sesamum radiatum]|uniref:Methyltransferase FkbM domain-containing protein n=1 Tax=Sesamum radiatum TaxID=300843 RepID=A0AAW2R3S4_SESRA